MNRRMVKYISKYIFLILLINHECIVIARNVKQHVSMKKNIESHVQQQMVKNIVAKLNNNNVQNNNGKNTKAVRFRP